MSSERIMTNRLQELLDEARKSVPTSQEKEEQRRSFAYGNTNIENSRITRKMIDEEAESLKKEAADSSLRSE
jgi:hypothetical protein